MSLPIDLTDVPLVSEFELSRPMKVLIDKERALSLLKGASVDDRCVVEAAFWDNYRGETSRGVAILLRFWCLVEAFSAQRFKAILLHKGYQVIGPAVAAASKLRLNAHWGFNPQRLLWSMEEALDTEPKSAASKVQSDVSLRIAKADISSQAA